MATFTTTIVTAVGLAAIISVVIAHLFRFKVDPREPPVLKPSIPLIGHIIGMFREGPLYLNRISTKCNRPIFTMPFVTGRSYIVKDPTLATHIQRASVALSFDPLVVEFTGRMVGLSHQTKEILRSAKTKRENQLKMTYHVTHNVINPLLSLSKLSGLGDLQLGHMSKTLNAVREGEEATLFKWVARTVTAASAYTFYGPENPFALHPELIDAFWQWEDGVVFYMLGILPQVTARSSYLGLEKCAKGFVEYFENGREEQASLLIRERNKEHIETGISQADRARLEVAITLGVVVNASITLFWVLNNLCGRPDLLAEVREEVRQNAHVSPDTISATALRESCPLLSSVFRETLRLTSPLSTARYVVDDTIIADTYLLRKDSVVQIAGSILHKDESLWGADVSDFNPRRFLYTLSGTKSDPDGSIPSAKSAQIHPAAFRGFGGGTTLCPGRHFAQMEITTLAAVLITGWDFEPSAGQASVAWNPPPDEKKFPFASLKPTRDVNVRFQRRAGYEETKWVLKY